MTIDQQQMLAHARAIVEARPHHHDTQSGEAYAVACLMDLMSSEAEAQAAAAALGSPIALILAACDSLDDTDLHAISDTTTTIRAQLHSLGEHCDTAFRRGIHTALQIILDDFADLCVRRDAASAPKDRTETIRGMALRLAQLPFPQTDPGPADPTAPAVPQPPRPELHTLLQVASLAAEESGLPIALDTTSDGVRVIGRTPTGGVAAVRVLSWAQITTDPTPVLSIAVQSVIDEMRA